LLCPLHVRELKSFQLQGGFAPSDLLTRDSAPGPRWGLCPQTPVMGSRSTRSPCAPQNCPWPPVLWRRRCNNGFFEKPMSTFYSSSIETIALNCLVFEKIAFFCILALRSKMAVLRHVGLQESNNGFFENPTYDFL